MQKNYKFTICYDGSRYHGWEKKKNVETIQGKLEAVLARMCEQEISVIGAGRTDAGVHAKEMTANAVLDTEKKPEEIRDYMNHYLPEDIAILDVKEASERFHARYHAVGKTYCYTCVDGPVKTVFDRKYVTRLSLEKPLNIEKMQQAAVYLVGEHDFKSFCGNSKMKKSTVRIIDKIEIQRNKGYVTFTYHGNGFLQNMVRILTGTLLEVGKGNFTPEMIKEILEAKDRKKAGPTMQPEGLCLVKVDY